MTEKTVLPYGTWPSPVSASLISQRLGLEDVQFAADGSLVWLESRSAARALVTQAPGEARRDLTDEHTPRGGVGYGGGAFSASRSGDLLVFANRDGRLYRRGLGFERPRAITPSLAGPAGSVASPAISPDGRWVVYVYSDGSTDLLALTGSDGSDWPVQLARGADFYMQPAWSPDGTRLAWVEWDHPNMPWDGARICLAEVQGQPPRLQQTRLIAGGADIPAQQPQFSPDGRWLSLLEERGEWADLVLLDLTNGQQRRLVVGDGFDLAPPNWVQGVRTTGWSADSRHIFYLRYDGPNASLWRVEIASGEASQIETAPYTWLSQLSVAPQGDALALIASSASQPEVLLQSAGSGWRVAAYTTPATYTPESLPEPREIHWATDDDSPVHGLYYPPNHPKFRGEGLPPALVHIHGGPTSLAGNRFNAEAAYFTSRGFAYVEVNYRGSTGYGRRYRHAMRQRWGDVDVEDCAALARALPELGLADPQRLVITGGSAGGYTVLNTLVRYPGLYKAGICQYGVTNLFALDMDTHKFEAHYNASLVGALPEAAQRYQAWSPVFHAASIRDALYIFQGSEDKVVPPSQAEAIVAALKASGVPHKYKLYEGEGHGFRKSETIADYLQETERFLREYVLFAP